MRSSSSTFGSVLPSLLVSGLCGLTPVLAAQGSERHKLLPKNGAAGDVFGSSIAADGALVAVGAPRADQSGSGSGSAYVFGALSGAQLLELIPSDGAAGDQLGAAIAIDGGRVVVGAPSADGVGSDSGAAYVFDATTGLELLKLEPADAAAGNQFGYSVAMDGGLVVVGSLGAAYLFDVETGQELEKLLPIGGSTTLGLSGFGEAVDIDAGLVVVGARLENGVSGISGAAYVYDAASGNQLHRLIAVNGTAWAFFGATVGVDGNVIAIGAPEEGQGTGRHSGAAYLFDAVTGQQTQRLVARDGHIFAKFGSSVSVDGLHVVIGSEQNNAGGQFSSGAVYVYEARSGSFVVKLTASDAASNDELGGAVAVSKGVIAAGAARDDDNGADSGSAYVFDGAGTVTTMTQCLVNAGTMDHVGGVAVAGQTLVFRMDSAQAGATAAALLIAAAPVPGWPSCGVSLGSAGELLIAPPLLFSTAPWAGSAVDFPVTVPPVSRLMGLRLYFQGAIVAPGSPSEPLRLTQGLEVVLGGYL